MKEIKKELSVIELCNIVDSYNENYVVIYDTDNQLFRFGEMCTMSLVFNRLYLDNQKNKSVIISGESGYVEFKTVKTIIAYTCTLGLVCELKCKNKETYVIIIQKR